MPKNTWAGVVIGGLSLVLGFAMVWWIWWLAILSGIALLGAWIIYAFEDEKDYYVEVDQIEAIESKHFLNLGRVGESITENLDSDAVTISV
jgi:cytochrome o ubiquinol oxidase subunit 1